MSTRADLPTDVAELGSGPVEYRLDRRGPDTVAILHGGHVRAGLALGEQVYVDAGCSVLVPSRPGYGRTPIATGTTPAGFADTFAELCTHLDIPQLVAVVGISAGGRTAITLATRHPTLVERLILESTVSFTPWPGRLTRTGAHLAFRPASEKGTWALTRALLRIMPQTTLRALLGSLTLKPRREVLARLEPDRATVTALFAGMRSGAGFLNDLAEYPDTAGEVDQPTLLIATRNDGAVPFTHSETLAAAIPHPAPGEHRRHPSHLVLARLPDDRRGDPAVPGRAARHRMTGRRRAEQGTRQRPTLADMLSTLDSS